MTYNPDLDQAMRLEMEEVSENLEDLMSAFLTGEQNQEEGQDLTHEIDEMTIRRMMFALKYLKEEEDHLKKLKQAVTAEWDRRIKEKTEAQDQIKGVIEHFIREQNKGKALKLDNGTVSLRKVPHNISIEDESKIRQYLSETDDINKYLKPAPLDTTLVRNTFKNNLEKVIKTEADKRMAAEIEESKKGKITKKREKEILDEVTAQMGEELAEDLPEGLEYKPVGESVSIKLT